MRALRLWELGLGILVCGGLLLGVISPGGAAGHEGGSRVHQVIIPEEDRFAPYALTVRAGDTVEWINQDSDDHTVVSDDAFTTTEHKGTDQLLPGTESTGGPPSTFTLRFSHPGAFFGMERQGPRLAIRRFVIYEEGRGVSSAAVDRFDCPSDCPMP